MNRREIIKSIVILPIIPYINTGYKTPVQFEPYEAYDGILKIWNELPFESIRKGDIVRRLREPKYYMKVMQVFPQINTDTPAGIAVENLSTIK